MSSRAVAALPLSHPSLDAAPWPGRAAGSNACGDCRRTDLDVAAVLAWHRRGLVRLCRPCRAEAAAVLEATRIATERADEESAEWLAHMDECDTCAHLKRAPRWLRRAACRSAGVR